MSLKLLASHSQIGRTNRNLCPPWVLFLICLGALLRNGVNSELIVNKHFKAKDGFHWATWDGKIEEGRFLIDAQNWRLDCDKEQQDKQTSTSYRSFEDQVIH